MRDDCFEKRYKDQLYKSLKAQQRACLLSERVKKAELARIQCYQLWYESLQEISAVMQEGGEQVQQVNETTMLQQSDEVSESSSNSSSSSERMLMRRSCEEEEDPYE